MGNPLNPLDWMKSAQDWFSRAERSSGFRPYLVYLFVVSALSIGLLWRFGEWPEMRVFVLTLLGLSFLGFIVIYAIKSFQDPDFCRSETHVHRMKKLELEYMGSDAEALPGEVIEAQAEVEEPALIPHSSGDRGQRQ